MKAIVVVDRNWGIGCEGKLLVHLPEDLKFFKEKTLGKVIVMGRETLETLPGKKPLPGRTNIILTSNDEYEVECLVCNSIDHAMETLDAYPEDDIFIVGGSRVYNQFLPFCSEVYVTKIDGEYSADRYFPNLDESEEWDLVEESDTREHNGIQYKFTRYNRVK